MSRVSKMAISAFCLLVLARILVGPAGEGPRPLFKQDSGIASTGSESPGAGAAGALPEARGRRPDAGMDIVAAYSTDIVTRVRTGRDEGAGTLTDRIAAALPPGWEATFVLHDCLVAAGSLEEFSNLLTHSDILKESLGHGVELTEADRAFVGWLEEFAAAWLARKHPALGDGTLREILRLRPRAESIPELGAYDILSPEERRQILDAVASPLERGP